MSSLKMYFWIFPPDINNIVLWRERERERERDLEALIQPLHWGKIIKYSRSTINAYSLLSHEWWVPP